MDMPKVSIIVPVYNVEKYLPQCLESLVNQTYRNIEIICVNDGATDNSLSILREYEKKDHRIVIVEQANKGLSGARNTGINYIHGKYLMFVDSDDWIDLETCECAVDIAEKENTDLIFWSYVREFENSSKKKNIFQEEEIIFQEDEVKELLHRRMCGLLGEELKYPENAHVIETAWGKLYLADIIIKNNILFTDTKEIGTEDALFNLYVLEYVKKAVFINKYYNHYRKSNMSSLTTGYRSELRGRWNNLIDKMFEYIDIKDMPESYKKALYNRIALNVLELGLNVVRSDLSLEQKLQEIKDILSQKRCEYSLKKLELQYFPIHWKVFYYFARIKFTVGVWFLLTCIRKIKGK